MSDPYLKFFVALDQVPRLSSYWDKSGCTFQRHSLHKAMNVLSSQERTMAAFFATVWSRSDTYELENETFYWGFNILDVPNLDAELQKIVTDWIANPYLP